MKRLGLIVILASFAHPAFAAEVKEVTSKGGFTAWLVEEHALPLVSVEIAFRDAGYAYDAPGKEGRANMTAAMLTEGAGDMDSNAFTQALESHAIRFNASVDGEIFTASTESLSEYKDLAFTYLGLALTKSRFDSDAIERTRRQTLSLIKQQEESPGYLASFGWDQMAYGKHPYAKQQLGVAGSVDSLGKSDLEYVAEHYLTKENIMIAVVGDITPDELSKLLDEHLGKLPAKYAPDVKIDDMTLPNAGNAVVMDFNIPQTIVMFGTNGLKRNDPDYFAAYVMNQILGGGGSLNARLGTEIREKRGLAYSVGSYLDPMQHAAAWRGTFATRNEKVGDAIEVFRDTLKTFADKGPTDKEMTDAKQYLTGSFVLGLDSNAAIASFLINMQFNKLGKDYLDKRNSLVEAVKKSDVEAVTKRIVNPDNMLIVMVGTPKLHEVAPPAPESEEKPAEAKPEAAPKETAPSDVKPADTTPKEQPPLDIKPDAPAKEPAKSEAKPEEKPSEPEPAGKP
jgi:zinc protease